MEEAMQWLAPWEPVNDMTVDYRHSWEKELVREVGPSHALFGLSVTLIGRRFDRDDALFALEDERVAQVHLTWVGTRERDPQWPGCKIHDSLTAWQKEALALDHAEWCQDNFKASL